MALNLFWGTQNKLLVSLLYYLVEAFLILFKNWMLSCAAFRETYNEQEVHVQCTKLFENINYIVPLLPKSLKFNNTPFIEPLPFQFWGTNCVLPDFQGLQTHLNFDSVVKVAEILKASAESAVLIPAENSLRNLLRFVHGEKHSEEEVHVNDDSEDYPHGLISIF